MKKLKIFFGLLLCVAVVVFVVFAVVNYRNMVCDEVEIIISDKGGNSMMTQQSVVRMLKAADVYPLGKMVRNVKREEMERVLRKELWFEKIKNLSAAGSRITLDIAVKVPLVQVFPENGIPYIITLSGDLLPLSPDIHDKLIVANGHILASYAPSLTVNTAKDSTLGQIYNVAVAIHKNKLYFSQYSQIFVAPDNRLRLYNNIFQHTVMIDSDDKIDEKLQNLQTAYSEGMVYMNHDYSQVDVRFPNRIYATRKQ